jgi:hypothetical protein
MWVSLFLIGIVGVVAIGFVIWPLFRRMPLTSLPEVEEIANLHTRKEVALEAIRELEFDHSVGKIENADFERFNRILRSRALRLIEQIDELPSGSENIEENTIGLDDQLESEIAVRRRVEEVPPDEGRSRFQEK